MVWGTRTDRHVRSILCCALSNRQHLGIAFKAKRDQAVDKGVQNGWQKKKKKGRETNEKTQAFHPYTIILKSHIPWETTRTIVTNSPSAEVVQGLYEE